MSSTDHPLLEAFCDELPAFSGTAAIRNAARGRPEIQDAALAYLERAWIERPAGRTELSGIAFLIVSTSDAHLRELGDRVLFRLPTPAGYQQLVPQLRDAVDDATLAGLIAAALASDDERVAANALDIQYHAYGFPDRFALTPEQAARIAGRVAALREQGARGGPLEAALARYQPPPASS
jgi:hypothetical protein